MIEKVVNFPDWGIVVDEGIQLGKVVISTYQTGSAFDRINNWENGFVYDAGDTVNLSSILSEVIMNNNC